MSTQVERAHRDNSIEPTSKTLQFSKAPIMDNFGELQPGEIPEPLKYSRKMSKLANLRIDYFVKWH